MTMTKSRSREMIDTYYFRVRGHLDDRWSDWFGGAAIHLQNDGTTVLVGLVVDQAALHGVITRIRDLGLTLLSLWQAVGPHDEPGKLAFRCETNQESAR